MIDVILHSTPPSFSFSGSTSSTQSVTFQIPLGDWTDSYWNAKGTRTVPAGAGGYDTFTTLPSGAGYYLSPFYTSPSTNIPFAEAQTGSGTITDIRKATGGTLQATFTNNPSGGIVTQTTTYTLTLRGEPAQGNPDFCPT